MPLNLPDKLPAIELLKEENIFVIDNSRATQQDIRPLRIVILNLMPLKITTETDLVRLLSNTPLQVEISFMKIKSHTSKNTPIEHMKTFYTDFDKMREDRYDGMIITGAPVEQMEFEEVNYWDEITEIFDWARTHVTSTLYICWAAQAGLYHHYGIPKYALDKKMFGIFKHRTLLPLHPIFRGFDDEFYVPHSRHTEVRKEDILKVPELTLLSESDDSGVYMVVARGGREFFVTGHGVASIAPAFERAPAEKAVLMFCKHCLRYSMGWCPVHQRERSPYREPYYLVSTDGKRFRLEFDCKNCQMKVNAV